MQLTVDLNEHLIELASLTQSALSFSLLPPVFQLESVAPLPNGLIRDGNSTFSQ